jgi:hypothetical protein
MQVEENEVLTDDVPDPYVFSAHLCDPSTGMSPVPQIADDFVHRASWSR